MALRSRTFLEDRGPVDLGHAADILVLLVHGALAALRRELWTGRWRRLWQQLWRALGEQQAPLDAPNVVFAEAGRFRVLACRVVARGPGMGGRVWCCGAGV